MVSQWLLHFFALNVGCSSAIPCQNMFWSYYMKCVSDLPLYCLEETMCFVYKLCFVIKQMFL